MASGELNAPILGKTSGSLEMQRRNYFAVALGIVPNFCSDIVLGQFFMSKHKKIAFKLNKTQEELVIRNPVRCGVATSSLKSHRLFNNLDPNVKPIVTKSKQFKETDQFYIKEEAYLEDLRDTYAYLENIMVCDKTMKDLDYNLKVLFSAAKLENLTFSNSKFVFACHEMDSLEYPI